MPSKEMPVSDIAITFQPQPTSSLLLQARFIYLLGFAGDMHYTPTTQKEKRLRNLSLSR
jgi:hypothetical protein